MSFKKLLAHIRVKNGVSENVAEDLKILGVKNYDPRHRNDKVYDALVHLWKKLKRMPTMPELREASGQDGSQLIDALHQMSQRDGRLTRIARGVYVPVMRKGK